MSRPMVSRSVYLAIRRPSEAHDQIITVRQLQFCWCGAPYLKRVVHNCCWASPAQSFSGSSPAGLTTIWYCLRFETSQPGEASYLYPQRNRVAQFYPQALHFISSASRGSQGCGDMRVRSSEGTWTFWGSRRSSERSNFHRHFAHRGSNISLVSVAEALLWVTSVRPSEL
jgi:hypothetical protein